MQHAIKLVAVDVVSVAPLVVGIGVRVFDSLVERREIPIQWNCKCTLWSSNIAAGPGSVISIASSRMELVSCDSDRAVTTHAIHGNGGTNCK